jgi:hypothetical protein
MFNKTVIVILIAVVIAVALIFFIRQRGKNKPIVLGQQIANATKKEQERLKKSVNVSSPMPEGAYGRHKGEWDLLNPQHMKLDDILRELCSSFVAKSLDERSEFRSAVSLEEFYTLIEFARRTAVFALRSNDAQILKDGLTGLAMIEAERTDFRDILVALALLHHSATRIGINPSSAFAAAAKIAEPGTAELISGFVRRDPHSQSLRHSWGYVEVKTDAGIGFAQWGFEAYSPKVDLLGVAMQIASVVEEDYYFVDRIELATDLPSFWLETSESTDLSLLLEKSSGGATVTARLDDSKHSDPGTQQFTVFMVELDSHESALALLRMSKEKAPKDYSMIGFASGRLFALLVARSIMVGIESFETIDSLMRFANPIERIIQQIEP